MVLIFSLLSCVVVAELVLYFVPEHEFQTNNPYQYTKTIGLKIYGKPFNTYQKIYPLEFDKRGYYRKSKGVIDYHHNQMGARWIKPVAQQIMGKNIIVFGDSFTYGSGLRYDDAYVYRFQKLLEKEKIRINFINFLKSGANPAESIEIYSRIKDDIQHNAILYGLHLNDLIRFPTSYVVNINANFLGATWILRHSKLVSFVLSKKNKFIDRKKKVAYLTSPRVFEEPYFLENLQAVKIMKGMAEEEGRKFIAVILPILVDLEKETFKAVYERAVMKLEEQGILVLDLSNVLKGFSDSELWILPFDQHPNEIANHIFAEQLISRYQDVFSSL